MDKERLNIALFGKGTGGIACAHSLLEAGHDVTIFTPMFSANNERRSVFSTEHGIYEDVMGVFCPVEFRKPISHIRIITHSGTDFSIPMGSEYFMVDYPSFVESWSTILSGNAHIHDAEQPKETLRDLQVWEDAHGAYVRLNGGFQQFDALVDSSGIGGTYISRVDTAYKKERDFLVEYVYAGNYPGHLDSNELILIWDTTGGTSWVNPSIYKGPHGEPMVDIVYSAWGWRSHFSRFTQEADARLQHLAHLVSQQSGVHIDRSTQIHTVAGMIRSQPGPPPTANYSYAVGEAAGIAKPKSGESFNRSLLHGVITAAAIQTGKRPHDVYKQMRIYWPNDEHFFSIVLARLRYQEQAQHARLMDQLGKMHANGTVTDHFIRGVEQFIIDGKLTPRLLMSLSKNPSMVQLMIETAYQQVRLKIFGIHALQKNWHLPGLA